MGTKQFPNIGDEIEGQNTGKESPGPNVGGGAMGSNPDADSINTGKESPEPINPPSEGDKEAQKDHDYKPTQPQEKLS